MQGVEGVVLIHQLQDVSHTYTETLSHSLDCTRTQIAIGLARKITK